MNTEDYSTKCHHVRASQTIPLLQVELFHYLQHSGVHSYCEYTKLSRRISQYHPYREASTSSRKGTVLLSLLLFSLLKLLLTNLYIKQWC